MYSIIQSWNTYKSLMLTYGNVTHQLLNGQDYTFIRILSNLNPDDLEGIFWSFNNTDILFYMDNNTDD